ncbi:MAG: helix-turn-helix domain-containing protein [Candidatus Absconditicoccaceae bacterium]
MEFSERLKNLRKKAGFTQVDVASKLGISQPAYASWERGVKKPTQENLVKIAQIFNVSIDYLVGNSEEKLDELDNIELLFRMNSKGLTDEEKAIFKKELIDFMEERKKAFEQENYNDGFRQSLLCERRKYRANYTSGKYMC